MADPSRYQPRMVSLLTRAPIAALLACAAWASPAVALPATYNGIAADGHLALFSTAEQMVPGDTDNERDVFVRSFDSGVGEYVTRQVSIGPLGGNDAYPAQYDGVSADGSRVFFSTDEPLVAADKDHSEDIYVRDLGSNATTLVSPGDASCAAEGCGEAEIDVGFVPGGVVPAGSRVFFATTEQLSAADGDESLDVYMRDLEAEETVLVSPGDASCAGEGCGEGAQSAFFKQASEDGEKVFFTSLEGLVAGDGDGRVDVYMRDLEAAGTVLVTVPGTCPEGLPEGQNCDPTFGGATPDGSHVFFESNERIAGEDEDKSQDVYDWSGGGAATLASTGPSGGNGAFNATYSGSSADGATVYFETSEALEAEADGDAKQDVYARAGETTTLVSTGPEERNGPAPASFRWASPDGSGAAVLFSTTEALVPEDTDASQDVYAREGEATTLVSTGPEAGEGGASAAFAQASPDGSHVFFVTAEALVEEDEDELSDIYLRAGEETALVSTGPIGGNGGFSAGLHGVSEDGTQAFFVTRERLTVDDDFASEDDVYQWSAGKATTLLVSVKNAEELVLGPPPPFLEGTNPASPNESTEPLVLGQAEAGSTITIYTNPSCSGEAVPPGGTAEELTGAGIPVTVAEGTETTFYATAELEGIVSPCSNGVAYVQEAAPEEEGGGEEEEKEGGEEEKGEEEEKGSEEEKGGEEEGGSSEEGGETVDILDVLSSGSGSGGESLGGFAFVTPRTRITFGPGSKTRKHKVAFRFVDATGQPGTRFRCKLDRKRWGKCRSPKRLKRLRRGRHVFRVKAVNAVGAREQKPQRRVFKVVR